MALYDPDRHQALAGEPWRDDAARTAIARLMAEAWAAFSEDRLWPIHPLDVSPERAAAMKPLYYGAGGVFWALRRLAQAELGPQGRDVRAIVADLPRRHDMDLAGSPGVGGYLGEARASYQIGAAGMRMLAWTTAPSAALADEIAADLDQSHGDVRGLLWGSAGAMTAATLMHGLTGEGRWRAIFLRHAEGLWDKWDWSDPLGCHVWTGELYGVTEARLGGLHGFAANALALARGRDLLPAERREEALERIWRTLSRTVLSEDGLANWPHDVGPSNRAAPMPRLLQVCAGAPGAILTLAAFPRGDARWPVDDLMAKAGDLIWRAGPIRKLPGLCHGVSGAGYALLKLFERTGDEQWLERARAFAMHGVGQAEQALLTHGQRKWSLWTGDLGLAVFLAACLAGDAAFPTLDVF